MTAIKNRPPQLSETINVLRTNWQLIVLGAGVALLAGPTLATVAAGSWSTEQGAHGPIVLAIALWLLVRAWPAMRLHAEPGSAVWGGLTLTFFLAIYVCAHVVGSIVIESAAMYGAFVAMLYLLLGMRALLAGWFAIAFFVFVLPPPGSWVATLTQPLRLHISSYAVEMLGLLGYPVARSGLMIYVDQYALEVRAACSGLNSMISLSAIGLFYIYMRNQADIAYCAIMSIVIVAMALLANFARVLILILITYHFGDQAAQGFLHIFAGLTMFVIALLGLIAVDNFGAPVWLRFRRQLQPWARA